MTRLATFARWYLLLFLLCFWPLLTFQRHWTTAETGLVRRDPDHRPIVLLRRHNGHLVGYMDRYNRSRRHLPTRDLADRGIAHSAGNGGSMVASSHATGASELTTV